jgi:hypothetical protein
MLELTIDDIDLIELQRPPNVSLRATISLAHALLAIKPKLDHPPHELAASNLAAELAAAEAALTARRRQSGKAELESSLREFDLSVDGTWKTAHDNLERWSNFETPGFDALTEAERSAIDLVGKREQAAQAASLRVRLFGGGLDFLRTGSVEQSAAMAERLRLIKDDGLGGVLDELVGFDITNSLMVCQGRYEQMVAARLAKGTVGPNLVDVRTRLRRQLTHYSASLVLYLMSKSDTESVRVVLDALRPQITMRAQQQGGASSGPADDEIDTLGPPESDEGAPPAAPVATP